MYIYMYLHTHMHRVRDNLSKQDPHVAEWRSKHQSPEIPEASAQERKVSQQHPHCLQARNAVVSRIQGCTMWQSPTESARADNCQNHRLPTKKVIWGLKKKILGVPLDACKADPDRKWIQKRSGLFACNKNQEVSR